MTFYIKWRLTDTRIVDAEEIQEKLEELRSNEAHYAITKTVGREWFGYEQVYAVDHRGNWEYLYVSEKASWGRNTYVLKCNKYKKKSTYDEREITPAECKAEIKSLLKKHENTTMCKAFKPVSSEQYRCLVPKPVYYIDRRKMFTAKERTDVHYIDVSAMYPSNARGKLPDAHTAVTYNGRVQPTKEYPFAFYLNSHHCAEYGVFDTHDYINLKRKFYIWQCFTDDGKPIYNKVSDEEEITVLMKPSKYELTKVFEEINARKLAGDKLAKAISNIGFGTFHRNPENYGVKVLNDYYHVAAIVLGRSNKMQYDMIAKIERNGGTIIQAIVDSLIYEGAENYGINEKILGTYYNEFGKDVCYRGVGINRYVIYDEEKILKCVVSGVENPVVKVPEDIDKYGENKNGKKKQLR